jgi:recombination endonuclease VII
MAEIKRRRRRYPKKHKMFLDERRHRYEEILEAQNGMCFLCNRRPSVKRRLDMDHNHSTMELRGLLCFPCNRALRDWMTVAWALRLAEYLDPKRIKKLNR